MVDSKEGASAFVNKKERQIFLDDEFGQDFLGSWNPISVTKDEAMDFNLDPVSKGENKKKHKFDKLDMDFDVDADFNKFSAFKIDIPDLDFSPPEKTTKPKEKTEDSSTGNRKGKKEQFGFSFDFDDDDFAHDNQFGSKLVTSSKSAAKDVVNDNSVKLIIEENVKESSNISDDFADDFQFGSKLMTSSKSASKEAANNKSLKLIIEENVKESSNIREDLHADGLQNGNSVVDEIRPVDKQGIVGETNLPSWKKNAGKDSLDNDVQIGGQPSDISESPSREAINENCSPVSENNIKDFGYIREGFTSDGSQLDGDLTSINKQVIHDEPALPSSEKIFVEDISVNNVQIQNQAVDNSNSVSSNLKETEPALLRSDCGVKIRCSVREVLESDGEQNGSKLGSNVRLQDKLAPDEEAALPGIENNTGEGSENNDVQVGEKLVVSNSLPNELTEPEPILEKSKKNDRSFTDISGASIEDEQIGSKYGVNSEYQKKETTNLKLVLLGNDECSMKDVNMDCVHIGSKSGSTIKSLDIDTAILNPTQPSDKSSIEAFQSDSGQNGSEASNLRLHDIQTAKEKTVNAGSECNTGKDSGTNDAQVKRSVVHTSFFMKPTKIEPVLKENRKDDKNLSGIRKGIGGVKIGSKSVGNSRLQEKEAIIGKQAPLRSNTNSLLLVSSPTLTGNLVKSSTQANGNSKFSVSSSESIRNLQNSSVEGHKIVKRTPELPSLKNLRISGGNRDIPASTVLRNNSLRISEQNTKHASNKIYKIASPGIDKLRSPTSSSKRKISEQSDADFKSLKLFKRLSVTPKESRHVEEPSGKASEETCNKENQARCVTKNVVHDKPTSMPEISQEVNMTELESSSEIESNVKTAEAYMKKLEDMNNAMKKKQEEAKELIVRATMNNNYRLLLYHPVLEEKICRVQELLAKLTLKHSG